MVQGLGAHGLARAFARTGARVSAPEVGGWAMDPVSMRLEYFRLGTSYYVSGRFAHYANEVPVAGNLFHHAVEMLLKGCLVKAGVTEKERRALSHDLGQSWLTFRNHVPDPQLDAFSDTIVALDAFEDLRYPEVAAREHAKSGKKGGVLIGVGPGPHAPAIRADGKKVALYSADTDKIDALVIALFKAGSCNPRAFLPLGQIGENFLALHNAHAEPWGLRTLAQLPGG